MTNERSSGMTEVTGKGLYGSGLVVTYGDGTDDDTIGMMFGHMEGFTIAINGTDVIVKDPLCQCDESLDRADDRTGIAFWTYDEDVLEQDQTRPNDWIAWDDVESVHVY